MSKNDYTTNKIYFVIKDIKDFTTKYDSYFLKLPEVYATSSYTYKELHYFNIQFDFTVGILSEEKFNEIMDEFCKLNTKNEVSRSTYKYKKQKDEVMFKWINSYE